MKLICYIYRAALLLVFSFLLSACGGGGGGGGDAESMLAPYLISSPQVSFVTNATLPSEYDVTVTIEADGPSGIFSASVWLIDVNDLSNAYFIDLITNVGNTWTGTTNTWIPLIAATYKVDSITLYDADSFGSSFRMGWYLEMPVLSSTHYYVDQRDVYNNPDFNMIAFGVSSIPITFFSLP